MTNPSQSELIIAHVDGGSRGNPGPAAYAVVVSTADGNHLASISKYLGHATNNVAEYEGLLAAVNYALEHGHGRLRVVTDSELMARQINRQYKVKNPNLKVLYDRARKLIAQFDAFRIEHVRREHNREADRLANEAMDAAEKQKKTPQAQPAGQTKRESKTETTPATHSKPLHVTATYHQGVLELGGSLPLDDGEQVNLKIERKK
jgi:ribonuclease HI